VDFVNRILTVEAAFSRTHEVREVPLNSVALKETSPGLWVFMARGRRKDGPWHRLKSFRTAFENACRHANLSGVTPHVLRHPFASRLDMNGASPKTLMELGGWKDPQMVGRCSHTSREHGMEAVESLAKDSPTLFTTLPKVDESDQAGKLLKINSVRL